MNEAQPRNRSKKQKSRFATENIKINSREKNPNFVGYVSLTVQSLGVHLIEGSIYEDD